MEQTTNKIIEDLKKKFCRKNAQTGEYEPKWFVKDATTYQDIEDFFIEEFKKDRKALCEEIKKIGEGTFAGNTIIVKCPECKSKVEAKDEDIKVKDTWIYVDILNIINK